MSRLPLALAVMLLSLLLPAALAAGATEPAPLATTAQDEDATGDNLDGGDDGSGATAAGVAENDTNGDGVITCEDFTTQDEAQVFFDTLDTAADADLIVVLDSDGNGIACEELSPTGAVDSGDGGTAFLPSASPGDGSGGSSPAGALLVLVALLTGATGLTLLTRRPGTR